MTPNVIEKFKDQRDREKLRAFMACARSLGQLTTCRRKPCGALLLPPDFSEILAIGYNGPPAGLPNDSCPGTEGCGCYHAEENCLVKARRHSATGLTLVVTRAPCEHCAGLILNSRAVARVVWADPSTAGAAGLALLDLAGLIHWRLE
jgi:deoxycytidylate deaminase